MEKTTKADINESKTTTKQRIFVVCIAAIVILILFNSCLPQQQSRAQSAFVRTMLNQMLKRLGSKKVMSSYEVRKLAHCVEYAALGAICASFGLVFYNFRKWQNVWYLFSFVLTIAVADESIQIISRRGPSVSDVLIDVGSACAAAAMIMAAVQLARMGGRKQQHKNHQIKISGDANE